MSMTWITLGCVLLALGTGCWAAENAGARVFHVDATKGDDGRDGLTPATAWRTLGKVNREPLKSGDKVLFKRGELWRGQLIPQSGGATGVVCYGAYGEGPKPMLWGSASMSLEEDWLPAGEGLWSTAPLRFDPGAEIADLQKSKWSMHQEGGAACTLTPVPAAAGGQAGYRIECKASGGAAHHVQVIVPGLSTHDGQYCLLNLRARCSKPVKAERIVLMKEGPPWTSYATGTALAIGTEWTDFTVRFHSQQTATDARLTLFLGGAIPAGETLEFQPGKLVEAQCNQPIPLSVDVGNIIFDQGRATGFKKWSVAELKEDGDYYYDGRAWQVTLRCKANPATLYKSIELALNRHIINQGGCGYVTYEDLDLRYGAAHGIGGGSTHRITVRNCDISYMGGGHQLTRPDGKPVRFGNGVEFWAGARDCLVEGCRIWEIYDAALTNQGSGVNVQENITYRRNVIWNSEYSFEYWNRDAQSRTKNIRFEHNTCVDAGHGWGYRQRPDPNGRHLMFYDNTAATEGVHVRYNIFCNAKDSLLRLHGRDWTAALMLDCNCWFQANGPLVLWGKENVASDRFAAFMKERRFDMHSIVADPKFLAPGKNDYRLAPDSPARMLVNEGAPAGALP